MQLTGQNLRDLVQLVCPDEGDQDQLETEVTITEMPERTVDGEHLEAGLYAYLSDYPEEGVLGPL